MFRNTTVKSINKCQIYISGLCGSAVTIKECFLPIKLKNKRCPVNM
jgi:hypothetical protein